MYCFSRTVAPGTSKGPALIALMAYYVWGKAVVLTTTDNVFFDTGEQPGLTQIVKNGPLLVA